MSLEQWLRGNGIIGGGGRRGTNPNSSGDRDRDGELCVQGVRIKINREHGELLEWFGNGDGSTVLEVQIQPTSNTNGQTASFNINRENLVIDRVERDNSMLIYGGRGSGNSNNGGGGDNNDNNTNTQERGPLLITIRADGPSPDLMNAQVDSDNERRVIKITFKKNNNNDVSTSTPGPTTSQPLNHQDGASSSSPIGANASTATETSAVRPSVIVPNPNFTAENSHNDPLSTSSTNASGVRSASGLINLRRRNEQGRNRRRSSGLNVEVIDLLDDTEEEEWEEEMEEGERDGDDEEEEADVDVEQADDEDEDDEESFFEYTPTSSPGDVTPPRFGGGGEDVDNDDNANDGFLNLRVTVTTGGGNEGEGDQNQDLNRNQDQNNLGTGVPQFPDMMGMTVSSSSRGNPAPSGRTRTGQASSSSTNPLPPSLASMASTLERQILRAVRRINSSNHRRPLTRGTGRGGGRPSSSGSQSHPLFFGGSTATTSTSTNRSNTGGGREVPTLLFVPVGGGRGSNSNASTSTSSARTRPVTSAFVRTTTPSVRPTLNNVENRGGSANTSRRRTGNWDEWVWGQGGGYSRQGTSATSARNDSSTGHGTTGASSNSTSGGSGSGDLVGPWINTYQNTSSYTAGGWEYTTHTYTTTVTVGRPGPNNATTTSNSSRNSQGQGQWSIGGGAGDYYAYPYLSYNPTAFTYTLPPQQGSSTSGLNNNSRVPIPTTPVVPQSQAPTPTNVTPSNSTIPQTEGTAGGQGLQQGHQGLTTALPSIAISLSSLPSNVSTNNNPSSSNSNGRNVNEPPTFSSDGNENPNPANHPNANNDNA